MSSSWISMNIYAERKSWDLKVRLHTASFFFLACSFRNPGVSKGETYWVKQYHKKHKNCSNYLFICTPAYTSPAQYHLIIKSVSFRSNNGPGSVHSVSHEATSNMTSPFSSCDVSPLGVFEHNFESALLHSATTEPKLLHKISISLCPLEVTAATFELGRMFMNTPILSAFNTNCARTRKEHVFSHSVLLLLLLFMMIQKQLMLHTQSVTRLP